MDGIDSFTAFVVIVNQTRESENGTSYGALLTVWVNGLCWPNGWAHGGVTHQLSLQPRGLATSPEYWEEAGLARWPMFSEQVSAQTGRAAETLAALMNKSLGRSQAA